MLGCCGIYCDRCLGYRGTASNDVALLEVLGRRYGNSPKDWVCLGCQPAEQPFLATYCASCEIRACAVAKGLSNCAACVDYDGCARLHDFIEAESADVVRTMTLLRQRFLDAQSPEH